MDLNKYLEIGNGLSETIFSAALQNDVRYIIKYQKSGGNIEILDDRNQ